VVSEIIDMDIAVIPKDTTPEFKKGIEAGNLKFNTYNIDTSLLHNTHSFVVVAVNNK